MLHGADAAAVAAVNTTRYLFAAAAQQYSSSFVVHHRRVRAAGHITILVQIWIGPVQARVCGTRRVKRKQACVWCYSSMLLLVQDADPLLMNAAFCGYGGIRIQQHYTTILHIGSHARHCCMGYVVIRAHATESAAVWDLVQ